MLTKHELDELNSRFESQSPQEILTWAIDMFWPSIAMSSSFQMQSLPLLHIVSQVAPQLSIIFLDTGYHFPETLAFRDRVVETFQLNLKVVRSNISRAEFVRTYGGDLYRHDPNLCCYINKVEPMERATQNLDGWISGIRRDQSPARADTQIVERTKQDLTRIHPMATWSRKDIWAYIEEYNLPEHPLLSQGYLSVGCAPCTRPVQEGDSERSGRWASQAKNECGLHTLLRQKKSDSQK